MNDPCGSVRLRARYWPTLLIHLRHHKSHSSSPSLVVGVFLYPLKYCIKGRKQNTHHKQITFPFSGPKDLPSRKSHLTKQIPPSPILHIPPPLLRNSCDLSESGCCPGRKNGPLCRFICHLRGGGQENSLENSRRLLTFSMLKGNEKAVSPTPPVFLPPKREIEEIPVACFDGIHLNHVKSEASPSFRYLNAIILKYNSQFSKQALPPQKLIQFLLCISRLSNSANDAYDSKSWLIPTISRESFLGFIWVVCVTVSNSITITYIQISYMKYRTIVLYCFDSNRSRMGGCWNIQIQKSSVPKTEENKIRVKTVFQEKQTVSVMAYFFYQNPDNSSSCTIKNDEFYHTINYILISEFSK